MESKTKSKNVLTVNKLSISQEDNQLRKRLSRNGRNMWLLEKTLHMYTKLQTNAWLSFTYIHFLDLLFLHKEKETQTLQLLAIFPNQL